MKHHYMPVFLQVPWVTGKDNRLWVTYRVATGKTCQTRLAPSSTGFVHDLYRQESSLVGKEPGAWEQPNAIETDGYQKIDNAAARVHKLFLDDVRPSQLASEDRHAWAEFLATLEHRAPRAIEDLDEQAAEIREQLRRHQLRVGPGLDRRQLVHDAIDYDALAKATVRGLPVARKAELAAGVNDMTWLILSLNGLEFITADYPVAFFEQGADRLGLVLPVSPSRLFIAAAIRPEDLTARFGMELALAINLKLIYQRPDKLYSREKLRDGPVLNLLKAATECLPIANHIEKGR